MSWTEVNLIPGRGYLCGPPWQVWPIWKHCQRAARLHRTPTDPCVRLLGLCTKLDSVYCYRCRPLGDWGEWGEEGKWCWSSPYNYVVMFLISEVLDCLWPRVKTLGVFHVEATLQTTVYLSQMCILGTINLLHRLIMQCPYSLHICFPHIFPKQLPSGKWSVLCSLV